jgi:hypothetical protein
VLTPYLQDQTLQKVLINEARKPPLNTIRARFLKSLLLTLGNAQLVVNCTT